METLEDEQSDDRSAQKAKNSFPEEIIEDILSRIPVKSILRFKSVSKSWLSLISGPSFHKLHSTVGPRTTALFFTARDSSTKTRYFFSGANDGGSVANLMKLDYTVFDAANLHAEHLNGLLFFTSRDSYCGKLYVFVFNPTTHKFFKLPDPPVPLRNYTDENKCDYYLFGFDEPSNEHKVLYIDVELIKPTTIEVMIFSISNYSWRKIEVDLPLGMSARRCFSGTGGSVCVNSVIHLKLRNPLEILAFDLTTETFYIVNKHPEAAPDTDTDTDTNLTSMYPYAMLVKINGLLGLACCDPWNWEEWNKVHIWMLQDYEKRVWVRETVTIPSKSQFRYGAYGPYPCDSTNMDKIIFSPRVLSENLISVSIYNMKTRCFKSIELTLGHRFLSPKSVYVEQIKCYVESLIPLQN
ncbi:putative F-box domain-containing protein [Helianthus annuus]|uniref:F-box domain-containing protein n=1 Tax=Helianthus annuus TaxID=4232 RepID=A0A251UR44_HELAN|nr:putative F-box protein At4g09190 [Helianthus annuus]KAF5805814.1 putative F-box domain-containing protein [Helianthus annuus]KAJ0576944.1 putative F-box domain-containing protein [Helianthus annuus]KAJ0584518.1 putative F-box domain-containing protein [Helianthus annuus]KAJ0750182.1 putative F-box domain-containing protein [Helianthus annuus]KAJ0918898.1 putative F-box domain-containing protein [Helianthus annuus]